MVHEVLGCLMAAVLAGPAVESEAAGNTDGVVTWSVGTLVPGQPVRVVVLLTHGVSHAAVVEQLQAARRRLRTEQAGTSAAVGAAPAPNAPKADFEDLWLESSGVDFALNRSGFFRWEMKNRQSLAGPTGGQLSQFTWYLHYRDDAGRRGGIPFTGPIGLENLKVVAPLVLEDDALAGVLETSDGKIRVRLLARIHAPVVAVEFNFQTTGSGKVDDVFLTAYANLEANHDHDNDYSVLDRATGGLLVVDPPTGTCVVLAGLKPPTSGHAGTWASLVQLQTPLGVPYEKWERFTAVSKRYVQKLVEYQAQRAIPLPVVADPTEPPTRTLSPPEADAVLERDWLFQSEGEPLDKRAAQEIRWTRELAARLSADPRPADLRNELQQLEALETRLRSLSGAAESRSLYLAVRRVKRAVTFKNPVIDFSRVLFIDQPYPQGYYWHGNSLHRNGIMAAPGGRLLVLDGLGPAGKLSKLAPPAPGSFWRPDLSFDANEVLYCYKRHDEKSFHLYKLRLDGSAPLKLTEGPYDDLDPIYLPNGRILFTTTRGNTYVRCGPFLYSYVLARCDADGSNVYLVSQNNEPDWTPALLDDGRVLYTRWEYTDKALWRIQSLWTTNQDGTGTAVFWGNQSVWPDILAEARQIPGSHRVLFTGTAHHDWFAGSIGIIDNHKGFNFPHGLTKVTQETAWPESGPPPVDPVETPIYHTAGRYTAYKSPYPLSEKDFLVSAKGEGDRFRLYLMDVHGNRELLYEGVYNIWHALPLKPRRRPPVQKDLVAWPGTGRQRQPARPGVFYSANVYEGVPELPRGIVKRLRVVQMDYKTYTSWQKTFRNSGPGVSIVQEEGVKRILGTAPVAADGSVHFEVPAGRSLFFQLLDEHGRCLQTMRSFTGVMPGEVRGCVGCHEQHSSAPPAAYGHALRKAPAPLEPPPWGTQTISFERFAQPVLDRHCGSCHQGTGAARKVLDLTFRPGYDIFNEPYLTLVGSAGWGNPVPKETPGYGMAGAIAVETYDPSTRDPGAYTTIPPLRSLSYTSRLVELAMSGKHYDVKVTGVDLQRLIAWVDLNCPYRGDEEVRAVPDPDFPGIELLPVRPRIRTAPVIERP